MHDDAYRERGSTGLDRDRARIWADDPEPAVPSLPSGPRCAQCGYRKDARGHRRTCERGGALSAA